MVISRRTARDIMSTPVHTVCPSDSMERVVELLCRHRVRGVPVVSGTGQLVGLISERDIIDAMYAGEGHKKALPVGVETRQGLRDVSGLLARDIMVTQVITAAPDTEFLQLASIMSLQKVRRVPIVEGENLIGIVSHGDVTRAIFGKPDRQTVCPAMRGQDDLPQRKA